MTPLRRLLAALACSTVALCAPLTTSASAASLGQRVDAVVDRSGLGASTSVYVWDQGSREVLYTRAPSRAVAPASTMKLLTSAAAMSRFGPDHRFRTRVALRGRQKGSRWVGDVWLIGGGDPSLSTIGFRRDNYGGVGSNLAALVTPLRKRGITRITGRIRVDDDLFDQARFVPAWKPSFRFEESGALGALAVNQALEGRWIGTRSSRAPDVHAGETYRVLLRRQGISVAGGTIPGSAPAGAVVVGSLASPPLVHLLRQMNQASDNFYAEIILKGLGASRFGPGASTLDGVRAGRSSLKRLGIDLGAVTWVDGSGLAYGNRVTARSVGHVVGIGAQASWGPQWIGTFARSGTSGTLRRRMARSPWRGRVAAKTGTLRHASGLAGFSERLGSGRRFGFVVLTWNASGAPINYTAARNVQDRVAMVLVR